MKKNYAYLLMLILLAFGANDALAQCIPTGVRPIFGTVTGSTGTQTFTNIPTGNVVRITAPAAGTFYTISMCQTNGGVAQADGVDDSQLTILDINSSFATDLAFNDDFCPTTGPDGFGPSQLFYTATAAGDIFVYLTEWAPNGCTADGLNNSYIMTVTITGAAPPCNAGAITTTGFPLNHCPGDGFLISTDGTESTPSDYSLFFSPQAGATGGGNAAFNFNGVTFPYFGDEDLNGVLSGQPIPIAPLSGNWAIYTVARDGGLECDRSVDSVIVNFLGAGDLLCAPAGNNLALENSSIASAVKQELAGFIPNFVVDFTERTNVVASVDVRNTNTVAATSFDIETRISNQAGTVTDVVNTTVNTTIPAGGVFTYTLPTKNLTALFPAQTADEVLFIEFNLLNSATNTTIDDSDTLVNFIAAPIGSLLVPYSSSFEIRDALDDPDFDQNTWGWKYIDNDGDGNTFGPFSFTNIPTQTGDHCVIGSITGGNNLSLGAVDETLQSPNLSLNNGDQLEFSVYAYTIAGQTASLSMEFTDEGGTFTTALGTINLGVNDTVPTKFTFTASVPATANDYLVNINKTASNFFILDLFEIVDVTPPAGTPCVTAANTYNNLINAGGAPCDDGTGCLPTSAGFTTFGIFGSEAYEISNVQAGFDYIFDMCTGVGAGSWIPAITIVAPSGAIDAFNLGTTGTFAQNCLLPWTATESGLYTIVIHEAGLPCGTETLVDNGNPLVGCGVNGATCLPCTPGGLVSPSNVLVCGTNQDSIVLDGLESTPGSYSVEFNPNGGSGADNVGFSINNVASFPWVFDNDVNGILSAQVPPLAPLAGMWEMTVYNIDAAGFICDSVMTTINVNFLDAADPLCNPAVVCDITAISAGTQVACNPATNTYEQDVLVTFTNAPATGSLNVNGQTFPIGISPQTVTLGGLTSDGLPVNVTAFFSVDPLCSMTQNALFTAPASCLCGITVVDALTQSVCNPITNTYTQDITVTYSNAPATGTLNVNGQTFPIGTSPQTVTLTNLPSNGMPVNVTAFFSVDPLCSITQNALFTAPASCLCLIDVVDALTQSVCNPLTNTYSQDIIVTYSNAPATGSLNVNGQTFPIGTSPQTVTLTNLVSDGNNVDIVASFSAIPACTLTQTGGFTAPASCACLISDLSAGQSTTCVNTTNTYTQDVVVTYNNAPTTGSLIVNGQTFPITGSPQTVTLTGLTANGAAVNGSASFTANPACTYSEIAVFTSPAGCLCPTINVNISTTDVTNCASPNGTATASVSSPAGSYTYNWGAFGTGANLTGLSAGTYTVIATDANGCSGSSSQSVNNASGFTALINGVPTNATCFGANDGVVNVGTIGGSGSYSYDWSDIGLNTASTRTDLIAGTYGVIVTDLATSCTDEITNIVISQPAQLGVSVFSSQNITCNGGTNGAVNVNVVGGTSSYTYSWSNGSSVVSNSEDLVSVGAGTYTLTVGDQNCPGTVSTNPTVLSQPAALTMSNIRTNPTCFGGNNGTINATVVGGNAPYTYSWSDGSSVIANTEDLSNLSAGTYTLTATDNASCPSVTFTSITITNPADINFSLGSITNLECFGDSDGSISITASGGVAPLTYSWSNGASVVGVNEDLMGASAGTYTLTVSYAGICSSTSPAYTVTEPADLEIAVQANSDVSCFQGNDGSITTNITGGTGVYNILWTNSGGTSPSPTDLTAGSYQLTVTDAAGCDANTSLITIGQPSSAVSATVSSTVENNGSADGTATATAAGGTAPYTYLWNDASGQTTSAASGLTAGSYSCTITDFNGCTTLVSVEVGKVNAIDNLAVTELNIYPNPTQGVVNISFETESNLDFDIRIMNTIGKTVMTNSYENVSGSFNEQFTLTNLSSGIYFVEISNKDAKSIYKITLSK